jgi:hypothetical protein
MDKLASLAELMAALASLAERVSAIDARLSAFEAEAQRQRSTLPNPYVR